LLIKYPLTEQRAYEIKDLLAKMYNLPPSAKKGRFRFLDLYERFIKKQSAVESYRGIIQEAQAMKNALLFLIVWSQRLLIYKK